MILSELTEASFKTGIRVCLTHVFVMFCFLKKKEEKKKIKINKYEWENVTGKKVR